MKKINLTILLIVSIISFGSNCQSQIIEVNKNELEKPIYVFDYESILSTHDKNYIEETIIDYKNRNQKEVIVVTTNSIGYFESMEEYATYLRKIYCNNCEDRDIVIIAISKGLKSVGISTSAKAQIKLTDEICKKIIDSKMITSFRNNDFFKGINDGLQELLIKWI